MTTQDRNFDDLFDRFDARIYDTVKGDWRLKLLQEDLATITSNTPLTVWDAGCGQAQISLWLAQQGHDLTLCDVSAKMLNFARQQFAQAGHEAIFHHLPAQQLARQLPAFDLVLFHAVIEWLADPMAGLLGVAEKVRPGGYLSLLFYNRNAMVYRNVLRGGWRLKPIISDEYMGKGNKLSPPNPQYPHELIQSMQELGFDVIQHTGIRVFYDYLTDDVRRNTDIDELLTLEQRYCRQSPYQDMGRYVHLLLQKNEGN